jgi:hypothetical protein
MTLPKYLYHYTSQKGLLGILQTNKLWMTNILYLNDSSEFKHTLDLVKSELENRINQLSKKDIPAIFKWENVNTDVRKFQVYNDLQSQFDFTFPDEGSHIYVFSLSGEEDDLSQWRGYCPKGDGFCIGFETEKISSIIKIKTEYSLIKCVYDKGKKEEIVKSLFDKLEKLFESSNENELLFNGIKPLLGNSGHRELIEFIYFIRIMEISPSLKDDSFINEKEYRIVQKDEPSETEYRQGNSMIIPYILLDNGKLPISKIIVGPTPHPELSKLSVESLLKSEKYEGVEVKISKIPYRSW